MQQARTAAAHETGIPSETSWALPNGFGSHELSGELVELPYDIATVSRVHHALGRGLEVYTHDADFRWPLTMTYEVLTGQPYFWIAINSYGHAEFHNGKAVNGLAPGGCSHFAMFRDPTTRLIYAPSRHSGAGVTVSPARLNDLLQGQRLCRATDDFIDGRFDPRVASSRSTPTLLRIADQIQRHPYQGALASVFLEAKALEILAEAMRTLVDDSHAGQSHRGRRHALAARDIIMADLAHPPRISDLAQQVGLSQRRLNEIFREEFDGSPLQCLLRWRLDMARQLLADGELTVKQVAHMAGYAHVSNFSLAFSRHFGHPPSGIAQDDEFQIADLNNAFAKPHIPAR